MQFDSILRRDRKQRAVASKRRHPSGGSLDLDRLVPFVFHVGADLGPIPTRQSEATPWTVLNDRRKQQLVTEHELGWMLIGVAVFRKLKRQGANERITPVERLAQIGQKVGCESVTCSLIDA